MNNKTSGPVNNRDWLAERVAEGWTNDEIAELAGCSKARVSQCMAKFGLTRYTRKVEGTNLTTNKCLADPNWLWAYVEAGWTLPKIAEAAGAAGSHTALTWIHRHGFHDAWMKAKARVSAEHAVAREAAKRKAPRFPLLRDPEALYAAVRERGAAAVSREIGCHISSVMRALERNDLPCPPRVRALGARPLDPRREAMVVSMLKAGRTRGEVAAATRMSSYVVNRIADTIGLPPPTRGRPRKHVDADVVMAMLEAGKTRTEIAAAMGVSLGKISDVVASAGGAPGRAGRPVKTVDKPATRCA